MNHIIVTGRLTKEPEVKIIRSKNGKEFTACRCSVAVDSGYGENKRTTFFLLDIMGRTAEAFEKYAYKGQKVLVEGEMLCDEYTAESGGPMKAWKIKVSSVEFLEWKDRTESRPEPTGALDPDEVRKMYEHFVASQRG